AVQVRGADGVALPLEASADLLQAQPLSPQPEDVLGQLLALGCGLAARAVDREEAPEIRIGREVTDDGSDRVGVQVEALGQLLGGRLVEEVGFTDLVMALSDEGGSAEQVGQFGGARHGSWVVKRKGGGE